MPSPDPADHDVIDALDSFYCHNVIAALWADAVANRLEGMAIYLLSDEIPEVAEHARAAARRVTSSSPSPTAPARAPSPATRGTAWTSSSTLTRPSSTRYADATT
jgi:hypothetical protein